VHRAKYDRKNPQIGRSMMDGAIDIRLLITIGGILFSVAGAAAVGKMSIRVIQETLRDLEGRMRKIDQRIDHLDNGEAVVKQRLDILAKMNAPEILERRNREVAIMLSDIAYLKEEASRMHKIHNGVHPPVASERKAT
tara:strand:+ start:144 stop:557 length:414 start_codon:yes stop_codon:yes gene_type:complete